jgi:hypothetical protein
MHMEPAANDDTERGNAHGISPGGTQQQAGKALVTSTTQHQEDSKLGNSGKLQATGSIRLHSAIQNPVVWCAEMYSKL